MNIVIPSNTLAELRGVLVRSLSKENLSAVDKHQIKRSHSASTIGKALARLSGYENSNGKVIRNKRGRQECGLPIWLAKKDNHCCFGMCGMLLNVWIVLTIQRNRLRLQKCALICSASENVIEFTENRVDCW